MECDLKIAEVEEEWQEKLHQEQEKCKEGVMKIMTRLNQAQAAADGANDDNERLLDEIADVEAQITEKTRENNALKAETKAKEGTIDITQEELEAAERSLEQSQVLLTALRKKYKKDTEQGKEKLDQCLSELRELRDEKALHEASVFNARQARDSAIENLNALKAQQNAGSNDNVMAEVQSNLTRAKQEKTELAEALKFQQNLVNKLNLALQNAREQILQTTTELESARVTIDKYAMEITRATNKPPQYIQLLPVFPNSNGTNNGEKIFSFIEGICDSAYSIPSTRGVITEGIENGRKEYVSAIYNTALNMAQLQEWADGQNIDKIVLDRLQGENTNDLQLVQFVLKAPVIGDEITKEIEMYAQPENVAKVVTKYCICATICNKMWYNNSGDTTQAQARVACKAQLNLYKNAIEFLFERARELRLADMHTSDVRKGRSKWSISSISKSIAQRVTGNKLFLLGEGHKADINYAGNAAGLSGLPDKNRLESGLTRAAETAASFKCRIIGDM